MNELNCIIQVMGGLGNQLFQYALGRVLQVERSAQVRYDVSLYGLPGERALTIEQLRASLPRLTFADRILMRLSFGRTLGRLRPLAHAWGSSSLINIYCDPRQGFDPEVMKLSGSWYLRGWWQCPTYFENLRDVLLQEIQPRDALTGVNLELQRKIEEHNAVCVHVRRGDLVSSPVYSKICKVQDPGYFSACMTEIGQRVAKPHFFVFSDEPAWCRQYLDGEAPITFVDHNSAQTDYIDLFLMSRCRHFIAANSTFSWWAAWLSTNREKIVIVPPDWGIGSSGPPPGLIPPDWQIGPRSYVAPEPVEDPELNGGFLTQTLSNLR